MATLKKRKQTANQWWFDFDNLITPASTPNGGSWTRTHVSAGEANEVFVAATNERAMKTNETSRISQPKHPRRAMWRPRETKGLKSSWPRSPLGPELRTPHRKAIWGRNNGSWSQQLGEGLATDEVKNLEHSKPPVSTFDFRPWHYSSHHLPKLTMVLVIVPQHPKKELIPRSSNYAKWCTSQVRQKCCMSLEEV